MIFDRFYLPKVHSQVNLLRTITFQQQKISIFVVGIFSFLAVCFSFYFLKKYHFKSINNNVGNAFSKLVNKTETNENIYQKIENKNNYLKQEIESRKIEIHYLQGLCYYNGADVPKNFPKAFELFQLAAEKEHPAAIHMVAMCYYHGNGIREDKSKAVELFNRAAEKEHPLAICSLAMCYYKGSGITEDKFKAFGLFQRAADKGILFAINMLGVCYLKGNGVTMNETKGFEFFERAAEQGDSRGQYNLASCYRHGWGTPIDKQKSFFWILCSARLNYPAAQYTVAKYALDGYEDLVEKDQKIARKWFHIAAESGSEKAIAWLENHPI